MKVYTIRQLKLVWVHSDNDNVHKFSLPKKFKPLRQGSSNKSGRLKTSETDCRPTFYNFSIFMPPFIHICNVKHIVLLTPTEPKTDFPDSQNLELTFQDLVRGHNMYNIHSRWSWSNLSFQTYQALLIKRNL